MEPGPSADAKTERLRDLRQLNLQDPAREERFDRITRIACRLLDVPMAVIALNDAEGSWFKSAQGVPTDGIPQETEFYSVAVLSGEITSVPDVVKDERFAGHGATARRIGARMYAGYPLKDPSGACVGVLCVIDVLPRMLTLEELGLLGDLGVWAEHEINAVVMNSAYAQLTSAQAALEESGRRLENTNLRLNQLALLDESTRLPNRRYFEDIFSKEFALARRKNAHLTLALADIDLLDGYNLAYGQEAGNDAVVKVARALRDVLNRPTDLVARLEGGKFAILLPGTDPRGAQMLAKRLWAKVADLKLPYETSPVAKHVTISLGVVVLKSYDKVSAVSIMDRAEKALADAKKAGRNCIKNLTFE